MYLDFLTDRCDVYHLREETEVRGYGLPDGTAHSYPDEPDLADVPCHFNRDRVLVGVQDSAPFRMSSATTKLQLPIGTQVRRNDLIVEKQTGCRFTAGIPRSVGRNHHIAVEVTQLAQEERM